MLDSTSWICCQNGAREHYAIPRAIHLRSELALLITDGWAGKVFPWKAIPGSRAAQRFHPGIPSGLVKSFDWPLVAFELAARNTVTGWELTIARDRWFQAHAVKALESFSRRHPGKKYTLFSYSYAALKLFEFAKNQGWGTVLGQIDPGPFEEKIVLSLHRESAIRDVAGPAPLNFWKEWRRECHLADRIIVNSEWSRHGLCSEGIPDEKLCVVPLAYDPPPEATGWSRRYPVAFSPNRPLQVLFLGQVNMRKGVGEILSALALLDHLPVEFRMVGNVQMDIPEPLRQHPQIKWLGGVSRSATRRYYQEADVFLFPTFSDGFGLTQLEAQAWNLPIIASRRCGDVVRHLENGYLLHEPCADAIAEAIRRILDEPSLLPVLARGSRQREFTSEQLAGRLEGVKSGLLSGVH